VARDPHAYHNTCPARMMAEAVERQRVPTPEKVLRDLAKNASKAIPRFDEKEPINGVK